MIPLQCANCQTAMSEDHVFCGTCGAPAGPVQLLQEDRPDQASRPGRFFGHPESGAAPDPDRPLNDETRYLCAAAYLNNEFATTVIGELIGSHRAVASSPGIDLVAIVRHCLNSRRLQLVRDIVLSLLLLTGLVLATLPTIAILVVAFAISHMLPRVRWTRRSMGKMFLIAVVVGLVLALVIASWFVFSELNAAGRTVPHFGPVSTGGGAVVATIALLILLAATSTIFYQSVFSTLSDRLRPGASAGHFAVSDPRAEARIAEIGAAQQGNVTLYGGENPFVGAGTRGRAWSIAIELDRADGDHRGWPRPDREDPVCIDPVELHRRLKERLLKLDDPALPENERIAALTVRDHVVGEGRRRWESPLIDPDRKIPYSLASKAAVDALIRHPQAGLRYYLQASVTDEGQPVLVDGQEVISRSCQEIVVSAFVYVAVEGRMFYLEYVPATLAPVAWPYHIVDLLPKVTSGQFLTKVLLHTVRNAFGDVVNAPLRALRTLLRMYTEHKIFNDEATASEDYLFGDVGARISIRELGAAPEANTYIQKLDAAKYTRITERLVAETVLDYLETQGADTGAYRSSMLTVINSGVVISGGTVTGPVAAGANSVAYQAPQAPVPAPAPAPS
jgi:hypothetical protein